MKGEIQPDHNPVNKFEFQVVGLGVFTAVEISGIEDELDTTELPDRTVASGGNRQATEFELKIPMHHTTERALLEIWYKESQDPVSPTYKKPCTLLHPSLSGAKSVNYTLIGVFPKKRTLPDLEKANEGEMAVITFMMSCDDVLPLG